MEKLLKNTGLLLVLIVLFGLILRLMFFSGMGVSDHLAYASHSYYIDKTGLDLSGSQSLATRLGLIYPTALAYKIFGVNDFSSVLFVLLTSLGNIILVFYFGKLLFNKKTGLVASFLMALCPLDLIYSTKLIAGTPSTFFMALGVYFFLYSEKKLKVFGYFLCGLFIGIGYMIKETAVLIGLFFIAYVIYNRKIKLSYFLCILGFLVIFGLESVLFYNLTGDMFFKINAFQGDNMLNVYVLHNYYGRLDFPTGLFHYPHLILTNPLLFIYFFPAIGIAAYYLIKKEKKVYTMLLWLIPLLLYLSFGSGSLSNYIPFIAKVRYFTILTIPATLLLSYFMIDRKIVLRKINNPD